MICEGQTSKKTGEERGQNQLSNGPKNNRTTLSTQSHTSGEEVWGIHASLDKRQNEVLQVCEKADLTREARNADVH